MRRIPYPFASTLLMSVIIAFSGAADALAFHRGGVGECEGCHSMHNSTGGQPTGISGKYLLKGNDSSSVCLNCHQKGGDTGPTAFHISTADTDMTPGQPPRQLTPGGDFAWLKKNYNWYSSLGGALQTSPGDSHGHNIVALDYGYFPDSFRILSPGGSYPSASMGCISCHDPHGRSRRSLDGSFSNSVLPIRDSGSYATSPNPDAVNAVGTYRLLGGAGYAPKSLTMGVSFSSNPPIAVAPYPYNRSESITPTRVAYGSGMSEWCRNCHASIHTTATPTPLVHPAGSGSGQLPSDYRSYYNSYVKSGNLSGIEETSYLSLVPFEAGTTNHDTLKTIVTTTPTKGPSSLDGTPQVMCLSCHRAHAGGWDGALRWNSKSSVIVHEGKYSQEGQQYQPIGQGRSEAEASKAYYDIPASKFALEQQPLCYKCHVTGTK